MIRKTWPYGTQRRGTVIHWSLNTLTVEDETGEAHILMFGAGDSEARLGDEGLLTFTEGGPTGGFWRFKKY